jgi:two-component system NtrC family sensor kinase
METDASMRRILVIDDESILAHTVHRLLRRSYKVSVETDGPRALALLEREAFDLVICDVMMSPLTGKEIYQRACVKAPHLANRFLFMTGGAFLPEVEQFLAVWPFFVLLKPFDQSEAKRLVAASLARADRESG